MTKNVYLISAYVNDEKIYKIGYTKREVQQRINELKTGNPYEFEIEGVFNSIWGSKIEAYLKNKYKLYNINGEWFNLKKEDIDNFVDDCFELDKVFSMVSKENTYIIDRGYL